MKSSISFDNTEVAFAHQSDGDLKGANLLFSSMQFPALVKLGTRFTPWIINSGLPVKGLIRKTIFKQFVGGETLEETSEVAKKLARSKVQVILDYGVEGKEGEQAFDHACDEFIRVIEYAATQPNIPFMSVKVTGFARFALLEKLDALMHASESDALIIRFDNALQQLTDEEKSEWNGVYERMKKVCRTAGDKGIGVLIDAEESWIQDPVDAVTMMVMDEMNKEKAVVYNTLQMYRHDRLQFLKKSFAAAEERGFILGAKLVRGAYMEKERRRAEEKGYASPIQATKAATDKDYNEAIQFCISHIDKVAVVIATHNEQSNLLGVQLMEENGLALNSKRIHFSQLYGMSDNITFNLANAGCSVSKYLPFGPIKDVIPYLMRRAQENTSVGGQTSRELGLIKKELERRKSR
ncbi:MAG: proline dehydrogenase family protein [Chitinophagaceae bacterium]